MPISKKIPSKDAKSKKARVEERRKADLLKTIKKSKKQVAAGKAAAPEKQDITEELIELRRQADSDADDSDADEGALNDTDAITIVADAEDDAEEAEEASSAADKKQHKKKGKKAAAAKEPRGVVFLGRIPHGFYEEEMVNYFSQFGKVTRLRLSRNKKTGASKHYAFVEFESEAVADVVASTMDNYVMFGHVLKCNRVPIDQVHPELFKGANRKFHRVNLAAAAMRTANRTKDNAAVVKSVKNLITKEKARAKKIAALGIDYDFSPVSFAKLAADANVFGNKAETEAEEPKKEIEKEIKKEEPAAAPAAPAAVEPTKASKASKKSGSAAVAVKKEAATPAGTPAKKATTPAATPAAAAAPASAKATPAAKAASAKSTPAKSATPAKATPAKATTPAKAATPASKKSATAAEDKDATPKATPKATPSASKRSAAGKTDDEVTPKAKTPSAATPKTAAKRKAAADSVESSPAPAAKKAKTSASAAPAAGAKRSKRSASKKE
ncbi:nucleolar protein [Blastocladiella emersonii ATCC 22665]|nr:nucleolar protein [Blastocladiella emersonii ATCC 22665]